MRTLQLAPVESVRRRPLDPVAEAAARLAHRLGPREDAQVLVGFVEDALREGLAAIDGVEAHFTDLLDLLRGGAIAPAALVDHGDNAMVLEQLETLENVVRELKRRLGQAAGKLRAR